MKTKVLIIAVGSVWFGTIYFMILESASTLLTTVA